ncbi:MAG: family 16 glycosylhydrolase [Chitinivibrionales bacterium]|nr:family 16 glycosylhydrolase [Chitinivibrionales bacterium]
MLNAKTLFFLATTALLCQASGMSISGIVVDSITGAPIKNVAVRLVGSNLVDSTDIAGAFLFGTPAGVIKSEKKENSFSTPKIAGNGALVFALDRPGPVVIKGYSMQGKLIALFQREYHAGAFTVLLGKAASGVYCYRMNIRGQNYNLKNISLGMHGAASFKSEAAVSVPLSKRAISQATFTDTLIFSLRGCYGSKKAVLTSSVTNGMVISYTCAPGPANVNGVPAAAAAVGYTNLVFSDDFNSLGTIDTNITGAPGFKWYADEPWGASSTTKDQYSVSNSVLTLAAQDGMNWGLSTYSVKGNTGKTFQFAYFEMRMHFDPKIGATKGLKGWPAWWSMPLEHCNGTNNTRWNELDFFEAMSRPDTVYSSWFFSTLHDWTNSGEYEHVTAGYGAPLYPWLDLNQWHIYGCLWQPGEVTWYLDNVPMWDQKYSATGMPNPLPAGGTCPVGTYSILDQQNNLVIIGTANNWPIYVDWVHVYQK